MPEVIERDAAQYVRKDVFDARMDRMEAIMDRNFTRLEAFVEKTATRLNSRMDGVETRLGAVEGKVSHIAALTGIIVAVFGVIVTAVVAAIQYMK